MKSTIGLFLIVFVIFSCTQNDNEETETQILSSTDSTTLTDQKLNPEEVKSWLIKSIEKEFSDPLFEDKEKIEHPNDIYTNAYEEYKTDAIGIEYDGGMTEAAFKEKWSKIYNTKYAGIGTGFLISAQDWGKIKVTDCKLLEPQNDGFLMFHVTIEDLEFKSKYVRDIKVVKQEGKYKIDDILEY
ncbi:hypothetical protein EGI22_09990 [Lacihabitans sp. LS3-19]|uniref:hypothetical protein n=1 Tax=Lacihabitans sp. LS3-19 TaxID=2487335 RepID=UPI0020CBBC12|nr:hypothetical protein [Lacihabitans sp. LS3-19]MCP9768242.1 hypothetical protein [Lacihabitans sp. LS3-19]